jgi:hypothetical protein
VDHCVAGATPLHRENARDTIITTVNRTSVDDEPRALITNNLLQTHLNASREHTGRRNTTQNIDCSRVRREGRGQRDHCPYWGFMFRNYC